MNIIPSSSTKLCISISKNPGISGSKFHNTGYNILNLNYLYIPLKLRDLKYFKLILKKLNIHGCSVSMPFKQEILKYLDKKHSSAAKTNAANTLVYKNGKVIGFNTDFYAIKKIMRKIRLRKDDTILLLGNGGVSRTIYEHIKSIKLKNIYLCARNLSKFKKWNKTKNSKIISWKDRNKSYSTLLINATPIGMNNNSIPVSKNRIKYFKIILDLVINNKSSFKQKAIKNNIRFIDGLEFSFYQASKQFEIYTKRKLNDNVIKKKLNYKF